MLLNKETGKKKISIIAGMAPHYYQVTSSEPWKLWVGGL